MEKSHGWAQEIAEFDGLKQVGALKNPRILRANGGPITPFGLIVIFSKSGMMGIDPSWDFYRWFITINHIMWSFLDYFMENTRKQWITDVGCTPMTLESPKCLHKKHWVKDNLFNLSNPSWNDDPNWRCFFPFCGGEKHQIATNGAFDNQEKSGTNLQSG